jgi:hypothetical protein
LNISEEGKDEVVDYKEKVEMMEKRQNCIAKPD